jgi:amino acid adenylation domain-containing protein
VVAVALPRDLEWLIAVVGIFKAGACYLPLDPDHPPARLAEIVRISRPALIIGDRNNREALQSALEDLCTPPRVLTIEEALQARSASTLRRAGNGGNLAYIIHTSGSTGAPKGTMVERAGMLNNILNKIPELGLTEQDRIAQTASQCFDISIWQLLAAPLAGARVSIFPDRIAKDPQALLQAVAHRRISVLESVPSLIQGFLGCRTRPDLPRLRWLIPTGEALAPDLCRAWMSAYPGVSVLNAYGPAECADDVAYYRLPGIPEARERSIPIGRPSANNRLYVLNRFLEPLPPGNAGELFVAGVGVGRGYLNDPARTAEVFLPDPFSGRAGARMYRSGDRARLNSNAELEFLGRIDAQVKLRGYRIELGEIEARLTRHARVRQAAVVIREDVPGDQRLIAYLVAADQQDLVQSIVELRGHLRRQLPEYMVPAAFVMLEELPLNSNGKLDLKALPAPDPEAFAAGDYVAPGTATEIAIAGIWTEVLRLERVGLRDNFFDLGGHSLLATQIIARVQTVFAIELPLSTLFEAKSVENMARVVDTALWAAAQSRAFDLAGDYEDIAL